MSERLGLTVLPGSLTSDAGPDSTVELHTRIEAMKLAYADVQAYDGDPRFSHIPVTDILPNKIAKPTAHSMPVTKLPSSGPTEHGSD
jgi:gamma-glutamyltranspeptidase/glutathione hydrolase